MIIVAAIAHLTAVLRDGNSTVVVVYWIVKTSRGSASRALNLSLETLSLNEEASRRRDQFNKGSPLTGVPPS